MPSVPKPGVEEPWGDRREGAARHPGTIAGCRSRCGGHSPGTKFSDGQRQQVPHPAGRPGRQIARGHPKPGVGPPPTAAARALGQGGEKRWKAMENSHWAVKLSPRNAGEEGLGRSVPLRALTPCQIFFALSGGLLTLALTSGAAATCLLSAPALQRRPLPTATPRQLVRVALGSDPSGDGRGSLLDSRLRQGEPPDSASCWGQPGAADPLADWCLNRSSGATDWARTAKPKSSGSAGLRRFLRLGNRRMRSMRSVPGNRGGALLRNASRPIAALARRRWRPDPAGRPLRELHMPVGRALAGSAGRSRGLPYRLPTLAHGPAAGWRALAELGDGAGGEKKMGGPPGLPR